MKSDRSRESLLEFLDYLANKGLMAKNTAFARKAAANKVLGVLDDQEATDVLAVDIDDAMRRFQNLEGRNYTPGSLSTYKSRVKAALDDFASYLSNPMGFRPNLQNRERKPRSAKDNEGAIVTDPGTAQVVVEPRRSATPPGAGSIVPIPIRQDLTVHIQGLPFDLTEAEARKIANVVMAMAAGTN